MIWQQLFQEHILDRGFDYYNRGLVEDFEEGPDFVQATVQGSHAYDVFIDIEDGRILDTDCECPYAAGGNHCKHMAALLFYMEDHEGSSDEDPDEEELPMVFQNVTDKEESVVELVKKVDNVFVRNFLVDILENDEKLLNRFKSALCCEVTPTDMKRYRKQINGIFRKYAGRDNFIDYYNAGSFFSELEEFLDYDIQGMQDNGQYKEAFELTSYIFVETGKQDMDDSDGGIGQLAAQCVEIWEDILEECDMELKRKLYQWFKEHLDGSIIDYMQEYIEQILFENFPEAEFLADKLKFTEEKVYEYKNEKDSWNGRYQVGNWGRKHIGIMIEQGAEQDVIDDYCKKYLEYNSIRKYYIENCIQRKAYDTAIHVLKEGKEVDKDFPGLLSDYSLQLKNLYKLVGNQQAYEDELWSLVLKYRAGDVDNFKELKSLYTEEEWKEQRETLFKKLPTYAKIDKLYEVEKLYDRLLKIVLDSAGLFKLTEYEKSLKKKYPKELLDKYDLEIRKMAVFTSDRKRYREMVAILRRMLKYPEGNKKVEGIVLDWRMLYKNRPAMMDELNQL